MKLRNHNGTQDSVRLLAQRLHLGRVLETAHGAGVFNGHSQTVYARSGWTLEQLLQMSAAKSMYN